MSIGEGAALSYILFAGFCLGERVRNGCGGGQRLDFLAYFVLFSSSGLYPFWNQGWLCRYIIVF